ncbi:DMT family transporter [Limosilactobacillus oris]|uniref:DMT family transporter n=1 Tax=Limosilactobacillus oris TaxID=1632 RepID=UPI00195B4A42|nr:DMT family transporter [Limosilactobacillus oris]VTX81864.1 putative inner membrane transporter YicL [Limosilactobacillus oris]
MKKQSKGILLAAGGASLWGISGAAAQYLFSTTNISNTWLVALRLLAAGVLLTLWSAIKFPGESRQLVANKANRRLLFLFAILGMANSQLSYFLAIKYSNAPTATVIQYLQPVFIILWLALAKHQWPRRIDCFSIAIALLGTFFLATGGRLDQLSLTPVALFWGIWCAAAAALYTLLPRPLLQRFDALIVCGLAMLISGLLAYIVIGGTMFSYTLFLQSIRYISPAATGILSAFEPLVATILAVGLLGTQLTWAAVSGSLLILFTTILQAVPFRQVARLLHLPRLK